MELLSNKVNRGAGANYQLPAEEWNQVPKEIENIISAFGITLTDSDLNQLGKAMAGYVGSGDFFVDGGVANSIVLTPIGTKQAPTGYTNGQRVRFRAAAGNTGATIINVNSVGSKKVRTQTDTALASGNIVAGTQYELTYNSSFDSGAGAFVLVVPSAITNTFPQGFKFGLTLSNNATDAVNDIDISAGSSKDSTNALDMVLGSAMGKRIDAAWTAGGTPGATVGGFPTGLVLTNNTWYHVFLIAKADGTVDAGFDTSSNAANLLADATGYTFYRHIGWVRRGVGTNVRFFQTGNMFEYDVIVTDYNLTTLAATTESKTVSVPPSTTLLASTYVSVGAVAGFSYWTFYRTAMTSTVPTSASFDFVAGLGGGDSFSTAGRFSVVTDASSQIKVSCNSTGTASQYSIMTRGWIDNDI